MEKRRSIFIKLGIIVFAIGWLVLCTMIVTDSGEFYAESKDGLWKGYITRGTGDEGKYQAYVCYLGNAEGNIGEIEVQQFCGEQGRLCRVKAESVPISVLKHFSASAPKKAYRIFKSQIDDIDKMTLGISWKDKEGDARYSSLIFSS